MNSETITEALILGLVEGLTEFIPVSSTAHLLLLGQAIGFDSTGKTFEVLIQLGAIMAIVAVYFTRLWELVTEFPHDPWARRFVTAILLAFLPAAVVGFLAHGFIKTVLFESPYLICWTLFIGGFALLAIDRMKKEPIHHDARDFPLHVAFFIGCFQCLAMIPGVSRSGATIAGALLLGTDKRSAAEFSFFLALPTMGGAFTLDLYKNRHVLSADDGLLIVIGFLAAFAAGLVVVRGLIAFVGRHGFAPFAYWRIIVALLGFAMLYNNS